jgi:hypothetical protein
MLPWTAASLPRNCRLAIQRSIAGIKRPSWLTIGWLIVLAHTAAIVHEALDRQFSSRHRHAVICFLLLATIGTLRRWGPPVLFALGGFSITYYWHSFSGASSSELEAVMNAIGTPAICGALGALIGYVTELACYKPLRQKFEEWPPVSNTSEQRTSGAKPKDSGRLNG